jgi:hypothetical protein
MGANYTYEDELPNMEIETYNILFDSSFIDGVRVFPCTVIDDKKYFLVTIEHLDESVKCIKTSSYIKAAMESL